MTDLCQVLADGFRSSISVVDNFAFSHKASSAATPEQIDISEWGKTIRTEAELDAFIGATGLTRTATIAGIIPLTSAKTIPLGTHLHIPGGSGFEKGDATATLTIDGSFTLDAKQIFFGFDAGDVGGNMTVPYRLPEWWGAVGDATVPLSGTDNTLAIQSALDSGRATAVGAPSHAGKVLLAASGYRIGNLDMRNRFAELIGSGLFATTLFPDHNLMPAGSEAITIGNNDPGGVQWGDYGTKVKDMLIRFDNNVPPGLAGIRARGHVGEPTVIEGVWVVGVSDFGIQVRGVLCLGLHVKDCAFNQFTQTTSIGMDIANADTAMLEGITINPNFTNVATGLLIDSNVGVVAAKNFHIEECHTAVRIRRTVGTPSAISLENIRHEGVNGATAGSAAVNIEANVSNPQLSVHAVNILRRPQGGQISQSTVIDVDAGQNIGAPFLMVNQYRRAGDGFNVVSSDYAF